MEKLMDWDLDRVIAAIEENRYDLSAHSATYAGGGIHIEEGFMWIEHSTWSTIVSRLVPTECNIRLLKEQLQYRESPKNIIITESDIAEPLLEKYGFEKKWVTAGMASDMHNAQITFPQVKGLTIEVVNDEVILYDWLRVVSVALFRNDNTAMDSYAEMIKNDNTIFFLGRLDGKPVATSALFYARGVAGIYFVSTLEDYRNRGIGSAMTATTMLMAKSQSYRIAILQATEIGERVYNKLGFERLSTFGNYTLR